MSTLEGSWSATAEADAEATTCGTSVLSASAPRPEPAMATLLPLHSPRALVLLSCDILSHLFLHLELEDHSAAVACKAWWQAWRETGGRRRQLRADPVMNARVQELLARVDFTDGCALALPSGGLCLQIAARHFVAVDKDLQVVASKPLEGCEYLQVGGNGFLYAITDHPKQVVRLAPDTHEVLATSELDHQVFQVAVSPCSELVFAKGFDDKEGYSEGWAVIYALDAITLEIRLTFGQEHHVFPLNITTSNDEVFVSTQFREQPKDRILVFSFSGKHLRTLHGNFRYLNGLSWVNRRLYVVARSDAEATRLFVVRPEDGSTLQVFNAGQEYVEGPWQWGERLLVRTADESAGPFRCTITVLQGA